MSSLDTEDARALHQARQAQYDATEAYRASFIDARTQTFRADLLETRACPVCGSLDHVEIFQKSGGRYVRCASCSMVFLNPVFRDAALADYYRNNNSVQAHAHEAEADFYRRIYQAGFKLVEPHLASGRVLDIGCSGGLFLDVMREHGFHTFGIELNTQEFAIVQAKGHVVWNAELRDVPADQQFDLITLWDVFEHIKDGIGYLRSLKPRLRPGGMVFMQIPSADSLAARTLREQCNMFDGLEHVNLYGVRTISQTVRQAGFETVAIESVIDELKPLKNALGYEHPYKGSYRAQPELDFLTPQLIHEHKLGYKLQVLLRQAST